MVAGGRSEARQGLVGWLVGWSGADVVCNEFVSVGGERRSCYGRFNGISCMHFCALSVLCMMSWRDCQE
jgi:hypothetical protein